MRLDKFLSVTGTASRSESQKAVRSGKVFVNGVAVRKTDVKVDESKDEILYFGKKVVYRKYIYIMMNKPMGVVSATEDGKDRTVLDLLPDDLQKFNLFPCGRLDKNTEGLILLTDNGSLAHYLLSPKRHVSKMYKFTSKFKLTEKDKTELENGVDIGSYVTKPCKVQITDDGGYITLTEGKYHQIKLMLCAVGNKVTSLERLTFGPLELDSKLSRGEFRYLTDEEIKSLEILAPEGV